RLPDARRALPEQPPPRGEPAQLRLALVRVRPDPRGAEAPRVGGAPRARPERGGVAASGTVGAGGRRRQRAGGSPNVRRNVATNTLPDASADGERDRGDRAARGEGLERVAEPE